MQRSLSTLGAGDRAQLEQDYQKALKQAKRYGAPDPESAPPVIEARTKLETSIDVVAAESEVFSHLFNFFRRYYSEGDFLSLRRYKEGVYAIPYEGEEVKLYWANADQYYIKTSENFRDYTFKLPPFDETARRVHFKLVSADTEQNNNKAAEGEERRFILSEAEPLAEEGGELFIHFEYRPDAEKRKQAELNAETVRRMLNAEAFTLWTEALGTKAPTEKNPNRTLLEKHLTDYTSRNTFDYFIHKDLGGFLRRELDFYIKNEIMHLDDIESEAAPCVEQYLGKVRAIRRLAHKIIAFLEQLENFEKKLWLKKKFVVETNFCVTLDRVPEDMYAEIAANDAQREEWARLFAINEPSANSLITKDSPPAFSVPLTVEFLKANPFLVLDTKFFGQEFKDRLLASFENLDEQTDGLLIHSENFQALNLLQERYYEQVSCIYIDPPYNTGDDDFPYKDSYQHSSWLSMLADRLKLGQELQSSGSTIVVSIDDVEVDRLTEVLRATYNWQELAKLVWDRNRKNDAKFFSVGHEYMLVYARNKEHLVKSKILFREPKEGIDSARLHFSSLLKKYGEDWLKIKEGWIAFFENIPLSDPRRRLIRYSKVGHRGPYRDDGNINWPGGGGPRYQILHPITKKPCRVPNSGWRYPTAERFWEEYNNGKIAFGSDETTVPGTISYLFEGDGQVMPSVFYSYAQTAAQEFDAMFLGARVFDNPKNWRDLFRVFRYLGCKNSLITDYFAGSGTTAHAVINLNREDSGERKYILVEVGQYFNTVLKPRIQKVIYSKDWKDGKPVSREGSSHLFKYIRLESYEDALNNIALKRSEEQASLLEAHEEFREDYMLRYMIDVEARGSASLLNVENFSDPFSYQLNIATGASAGETRPVAVDLVETFNYLIGLRVRRVETVCGFRVVKGTNLEGENVLVIWRNTREKSNDELDEFFRQQGYNTRDRAFDIIYTNGDNNLENLRRPDETWKVRLIEETFQRLMFDGQDV